LGLLFSSLTRERNFYIYYSASLTRQKKIIISAATYKWRACFLLVPPPLLNMSSSFSDIIAHTAKVYETDNEMPTVGEVAKATALVHHAVAEDTT